jgi:hypothetical protein
MMARNTNVPFKGRIQKRKTNDLQIIIFGLQRAAGPYRWARLGCLCLESATFLTAVGGRETPRHSRSCSPPLNVGTGAV